MKYAHLKKKDSYKIYQSILFVLIYVILAITVYSISYEITSNSQTNSNSNSNSPEPIAQSQPFQEAEIETHTVQEYIVRDSNGKVAIFNPNEHEPFIVLDIYTNSLPYVDKQDILDGIIINGDDNLRAFIEDFDS